MGIFTIFTRKESKMDFVEVIAHKNVSNRRTCDYKIVPSFKYGYVQDLVVRGKAFYAFWTGKSWSTDINDLIVAVDSEVKEKYVETKNKFPNAVVNASYMRDYESQVRTNFENYVKMSPNSDKKFNTHILFKDHDVVREDYATTQLSYTPEELNTPSFDEMMDVLYDKVELEKIMWFMGAALTNNMKDIQKFMYLYGGKGTGKGTVIDIFKMVFEGYYAEIDLAKLTGGSEFATAQVQEVPILVDSDSDISKIKQDVNLLKLTAHEPLAVNKKYQSQYEVTFEGLLITASNQRYKVGNVDSGINRRAVVVEPSNRKIPLDKYRKLKKQIKFELPGIAMKSMSIFNEQGPAYYDSETDVDMMMATDLMFSFVRENATLLGDPTTLKQASELYKLYLEDLGYDTTGYKRKLKNELQRYYDSFDERGRIIDGVRTRNVYSGFKRSLVFPDEVKKDVTELTLELNSSISQFEAIGALYPAQLANSSGTPQKAWSEVTGTLKDIDTTQLHYVRVPKNHIVIDFDIKNEKGEKDRTLNLRRAAEFPPTYSEYSKGGEGVHLHYIYDGDVDKLSSVYEPGIEVKVFSGKMSLRRKLSKCNDLEVATISSGLPIKEEEKLVYQDIGEMVWNEAKMRTAIKKNLKKEYHPATKPSMDFIAHIFSQAEESGVEYDLTDMRNDILVFASRSSHQPSECIKIANKINYSTVKVDEPTAKKLVYDDSELYFFDIEVYPNLLIVCWKKHGIDEITTWFNPTPAQIEWLTSKPLVAFNNRRYDNHILYGRLVGDDNLEMFKRSSHIVGDGSGMLSGAYDLSYADIYEYTVKKQSLKKWEVELGIKHDEFELPWDQPLDEKDWQRAGEYCANDVIAAEAVFEATYEDYVARKMLAALSGLPMNAKTQEHAAAFLFGNDKRPQDKFIHTDLSEEFPGYKFEFGKSTYRGEEPGEGGYVYSNPGVHKNAVEIDVASMHPSSMIALNYLGPYTQRFKDLKQSRVFIKHGEFDKASKMFEGKLAPYLTEGENAKALADALKRIINIVYGMSSAKYDNKFREPKNLDNVVAKRGALFMISLKHIVQDAGYEVVHIKTDSIKIANVDDDIINIVIDYGKKYGYDFEVEHIFERLALVNKAVLIGKVEDNDKWGRESGKWEAIGSEFAEPYVYKTIFTQEDIEEIDFATTKQVKSTMYIGDEFVGKVGQVYASKTGQELKKIQVRNGEESLAYVTGTKGFNWRLYSDWHGKEDVDMSYYDGLVKDAVSDIAKVSVSEERTKWFFEDASDEIKELLEK